jgi:hypothetical protein
MTAAEAPTKLDPGYSVWPTGWRHVEAGSGWKVLPEPARSSTLQSLTDLLPRIDSEVVA